MWTNGSSAALLTPAKARTTGNPSPSWPRGPVVIERTGRSVSDTPATVTRAIRDKANVSAVIAGICSLLVLRIPAITGPRSDYSRSALPAGTAGRLRRLLLGRRALV